MTEIIGVRFRGGDKEYYFNPNGLTAKRGTQVIVETTRGQEIATCVRGNTMVQEELLLEPLRPVVRLATAEDLRSQARYHAREPQALALCQAKVAEHGLEMNLVSAQYNFDGTKILFNFTADGRVDFRDLVRDLASLFHARIELRQIGVRDEARMLGGLGICGRPFCCAGLMCDFQPVSIKMAKVQNLSLNPTKISGTCGRLMCCLNYEQEAYEDAVRRLPKEESFVETPDGVGTVTAVDLLREQVKVQLEDSADAPKSYRPSEINVIRRGRGKRPEDYVTPPKEELEKRRYIPETEPDSLSEQFAEQEEAALREPIRRDGGHSRRRGSRSRGAEPRPEQKPAAPGAEAQKPAENGEKKQGRGRGNRPNRSKAADGGRQTRPQNPAPEQKSAPRPEQKSAAPGAEGQKPAEGGEKKRSYHRRWYHGKKGGGKPGAPTQG